MSEENRVLGYMSEENRVLGYIRKELWRLYEKINISKEENSQPLLTNETYSKLKNKFSKKQGICQDISYLIGELRVSTSGMMHNNECMEREIEGLINENSKLEKTVEVLSKGKNN